MEAQVSLTVTFSSSACFGLLFLIFLLTIPHIFSMGFRSGEFAGQSSTPTPWSFKTFSGSRKTLYAGVPPSGDGGKVIRHKNSKNEHKS